MVLRPQDIVVSVALALRPDERWSFPAIARTAGLSLSEAHAAVRRATQARLLAPDPKGLAPIRALRENLIEFLIHGVKYAFPAERGETTRGIPTAHSAPVLVDHLASASEAPLVWPAARGHTRGETLLPLYKSVPEVCMTDSRIYDALALIDAIRVGSAREREVASVLLRNLILGMTP